MVNLKSVTTGPKHIRKVETNMRTDFGDIKSILGMALKRVDNASKDYDELLDDNAKMAREISDLKTEVGRLEALLADKKPESECECCKCRDEVEDESEPTLKDLYKLGKYLVDTVDEIESIHIRVVRSKNADTNDTNDAE
jgi:hypothetical protein